MEENVRKALLALGLVGGFGLLAWLGTRRSSPGHSSSPQVAAEVAPPIVWPDSAIIARKREEWTAKGYPSGLQDKAIDWAKGWSAGIARRVGLPEAAPKVYERALDLSERWMQGLWGLFA